MSRKPKDLTGQKFGNLVVKEYAGKVGEYPSWWVECKCGKKFTVPAYNFRQGDTVGCPYCQTHAEATSILWQGQRITIIPRHCHNGRSVEYLGELVKQITNNSEANAVLIMLDPMPDELLSSLGTELEDPAGSADSADSAADEWENNATHFDKPVDNM
jgi:hypothetical protein